MYIEFVACHLTSSFQDTRELQLHNPAETQILVTIPEMLSNMLLTPALAQVWTPRIRRIIFDEIHCKYLALILPELCSWMLYHSNIGGRRGCGLGTTDSHGPMPNYRIECNCGESLRL